MTLTGAASRTPAACLLLLGGAGREGQSSLSSWTRDIEGNTRPGPGKAEASPMGDLTEGSRVLWSTMPMGIARLSLLVPRW